MINPLTKNKLNNSPMPICFQDNPYFVKYIFDKDNPHFVKYIFDRREAVITWFSFSSSECCLKHEIEDLFLIEYAKLDTCY